MQINTEEFNSGSTDDIGNKNRCVTVTVRQKLDVEDDDRYLSIIFTRRNNSTQIGIVTYMTERKFIKNNDRLTEEFIPIGDMRTDSVENGLLVQSSKSDQTIGFGEPEKPGFIPINQHRQYMARAYLLLANSLFSVGQMPQIGSPQRFKGFFKNS